MRYYYRLEKTTEWHGPYDDGRACIFDAAFAGQQAHTGAQAIVIADDQNPDSITDEQAQLFNVPTHNLAGDMKHPMYEPPVEWVNEQQLGDGTEDPDEPDLAQPTGGEQIVSETEDPDAPGNGA